MGNLTEHQKFAIDKVREDEMILMSDIYLGDTVFELARQGKSTDEILVWLWTEQNLREDDKYWLMPQAVNNFLTKRWLTKEVRTALRNVPILAKVDEGLDYHIENKNAKVLMFMKEKLDPDFKKKEETNVTNIAKQITQINIQVVGPEPEDTDIIDVIPDTHA